MRIQNRYISGAFKALLAASAWVGICIQCGVFSGKWSFLSLRYYTLISNVLVACYFSVAAVWAFRGQPAPAKTFKGALIMGITVTGIVYHTLLSGGFSMGGTQELANRLLHTVTPIMAVLDWLLFDPKGEYDKCAPLMWTILPDVYFLLATLYGFAGGASFYGGARFPYFFINYDQFGVGRVLLNVVLLNIAFIALGYLFYGVDRLAGKKSPTTRTPSA